MAANPQAGAFFDALAQFYRRACLRWIDATKRSPDRRADRIAEMVELLAAGAKQRPIPYTHGRGGARIARGRIARRLTMVRRRFRGEPVGPLDRTVAAARVQSGRWTDLTYLLHRAGARLEPAVVSPAARLGYRTVQRRRVRRRADMADPPSSMGGQPVPQAAPVGRTPAVAAAGKPRSRTDGSGLLPAQPRGRVHAVVGARLAGGVPAAPGWGGRRRRATRPPYAGPGFALVDCEAGIRRSWAQLCSGCDRRFKAAGRPFEEFVARASGKANWNERICRVGGCPRPTRARDRLCRSHTAHRRTRLDLSVEAWLELPSVRPLVSFGDCRVASCVRAADGRRGLCGAHDMRWAEHRQSCPDADFDVWAAVNGPAGVDHIVVLKGLPTRVQRELLVMLQQRTDEGLRTFLTDVRYLAGLLRARRAGTVFDLSGVKSTDIRPTAGALLRMTLRTVRCALSTPDSEQAGDKWDLAVLGLPGRLDFTKISQRWLRGAPSTGRPRTCTRPSPP